MCACRGTAGFAHVSCLAEQAKILVAEGEENNLGNDALQLRWDRWHTCSLCEQRYYGIVKCALGWACWKTYVGRREAEVARDMAMNLLGNGLTAANYHEDALTVKEAELAMRRRLGSSEQNVLVAQGNLANTYAQLGHYDETLRLQRDVYSGTLKLHGEENVQTLGAAFNCANTLFGLNRFKEAKSVLRKMVPVARRALGDPNDLTLSMRKLYARALCENPAATLDDLREAVTTLEDVERTARRVFGGAHPSTSSIEQSLRNARAALAARETPPRSA